MLNVVADKAIKAVHSGNVVKCSKEEYRSVRTALQDFAATSIDRGDGLRAQIALEEVRRLDKEFSFKVFQH